MKKKYKIILLIIGILLAIALATGSSYAYWIYTAVQEGVNRAESDCFNLTFSESNDISLLNTVPMSEKEGSELTPYTFTIKNVCNHAADYDVNMETLSNSTLDVNYLRYKIDNKKSKILGDAIEVDAIDYVNSNTIKSNNIVSGTLEKDEEKTFNIRIWIDEDSTVEQSASKVYESKIVVKATLNAHYSSTMLVGGQEFIEAIKKLANPGKSMGFSNTDYNIKHIKHSSVLPSEEIEKVNVSLSSDKPVYVWFDDGTIYYYSDSERIYLNSNSQYMFYSLYYLEDIDLSTFDTSKVTNMSYMFDFVCSLKDLDLSSFDTSNVTNMKYMLSYLISLTSLNLESFDTLKVTDMSYMFAGMNSITSLDLSFLNTSNVTNMSNMFAGCKLEELDLSTFDTSNVTNMSRMFANMDFLTSLDISSFDTSQVTDMSYMFAGMNSITSLDLSFLNTSNVTNMSNMFAGCELEELDLSTFDTSNVTNMSRMFYDASNLKQLDLSDFNTSKVTNMSTMFMGMLSLENIDLSSFDTSNVTTFDRMFWDAEKLETLDLSNFVTTKVTDMSYMFNNMKSLKNVNVSNFDTSKVKDMTYMFGGATSLTVLDISSFDSTSLTSISCMFYSTKSIRTIYIGEKWNVLGINDGHTAFSGCTYLVGGAGTTFTNAHIGSEYARVDDPDNGKPGYFTLKTS